jgi:hypothetical protein
VGDVAEIGTLLVYLLTWAIGAVFLYFVVKVAARRGTAQALEAAGVAQLARRRMGSAASTPGETTS